MLSRRIPHCGVCGHLLVKNGFTSAGRQRWRCACGASHVNKKPGKTRLAHFTSFLAYLAGQASQCELTDGMDPTFRRRISWWWTVPTPSLPMTGEVYDQVFVDGIYLAYDWCLLIARNTTHVVAWQWATRENTAAYTALLGKLTPPDLVTTDEAGGALSSITRMWPHTPVQRCLLHVHRNNIRDLTTHPHTPAGRALLGLSQRLLKITTGDPSSFLGWSAHPDPHPV